MDPNTDHHHFQIVRPECVAQSVFEPADLHIRRCFDRVDQRLDDQETCAGRQSKTVREKKEGKGERERSRARERKRELNAVEQCYKHGRQNQRTTTAVGVSHRTSALLKSRIRNASPPASSQVLTMVLSLFFMGLRHAMTSSILSVVGIHCQVKACFHRVFKRQHRCPFATYYEVWIALPVSAAEHIEHSRCLLALYLALSAPTLQRPQPPSRRLQIWAVQAMPQPSST